MEINSKQSNGLVASDSDGVDHPNSRHSKSRRSLMMISRARDVDYMYGSAFEDLAKSEDSRLIHHPRSLRHQVQSAGANGSVHLDTVDSCLTGPHTGPGVLQSVLFLPDMPLHRIDPSHLQGPKRDLLRRIVVRISQFTE